MKLHIPRFKKLNAAGISHLVVPIVAVLAIGAIGTYLLTSSHADTIHEDCTKTTAKYGKYVKYNCQFWATAPVKDDYTPRRTTGTLHAGTNWVLCQEQIEVFSSAGNYNNWWAYTKADNGKWGWVNGVYGKGGKSNKAVTGAHYTDGQFAGVPLCYNLSPYPPSVYPTAVPVNQGK